MGIFETRPRNLALIAKLNWKLLSEDHSLWAQVLKAKYLSNNTNRNPWTSKGSCSHTWTTCKAAKSLLDSGIRKVITSNASTSFWFDNWTFHCPLRAQLIGPLNYGEENQFVSQAIDTYGNWNLQLSFDLPDNILKLIQAIPTNLASQGGELIAWAFTNDGEFYLQTAYNAAKGLNTLNPNTPSLTWIWKLRVPPKLVLFIWLCSYNSIPVKEVLGSRGLSLDQHCSICKSQTESISHMLRECPYYVSFWNWLSLPTGLYNSFSLPLSDWLHDNGSSILPSRHHDIPWSTLFLFSLWSLWTNRNSATYQAKPPN